MGRLSFWISEGKQNFILMGGLIMKKSVLMAAIAMLSGVLLTGCNPASATKAVEGETGAVLGATEQALSMTNSTIGPIIEQATAVYDYLCQGHSFVACEDGKAVLLYYSGKDIVMESVGKENGKIKIENIDGQWDKVYSTLNILDVAGTSYSDYSWNITNEGELIIIELTNGRNTVNFYELSGSEITDAEDIAEKYVKRSRLLEDIEDLSTAIEGYTGTSIVDAFILSGLKPDFATRAQVAEALGIENYKGTAEQNIQLINLLGGVVK